MFQSLSFKDYIDIVASLATVVALIIGGAWSYQLFVARRQKYPRAKLQQQISHKRLERGYILLMVSVIVTNDGEVLLPLTGGEIYIWQLCPAPKSVLEATSTHEGPARDQQLEWPLLAYETIALGNVRYRRGKRNVLDRLRGRTLPSIEIEPKEEGQFFYRFIIPNAADSILVESSFGNSIKGNELGWQMSTVYDLRDAVGSERTRRRHLSLT